jgi:hypothetical protein
MKLLVFCRLLSGDEHKTLVFCLLLSGNNHEASCVLSITVWR